MFTKFKLRDPRASRARRASAWIAVTIFSFGLSGKTERENGRGYPGRRPPGAASAWVSRFELGKHDCLLFLAKN